MDKDRIAGAAEGLTGKAKVALGTTVGDDAMVARGHAQRVAGKRRNIAGSIRDIVRSMRGR